MSKKEEPDQKVPKPNPSAVKKNSDQKKGSKDKEKNYEKLNDDYLRLAAEFENYKNFGLEIGFEVVESGALVRSSYHADEQARLIAKRSDNVI